MQSHRASQPRTITLVVDCLIPAYGENAFLASSDLSRTLRASARSAIKMAVKELGPAHPYVAKSVQLVGDLYKAQRRFANAETMYSRALAIREKAYRPDHKMVAISLSKMADLYIAMELFAQAEPQYKRALVIPLASHNRIHHGVDHFRLRHTRARIGFAAVGQIEI